MFEVGLYVELSKAYEDGFIDEKTFISELYDMGLDPYTINRLISQENKAKRDGKEYRRTNDTGLHRQPLPGDE